MKLDRRQALGLLGAGVAAVPAAAAAPEDQMVVFSHGVASGDPLQDRVIIWTHVPPRQDGPVEVRWEVSEDPDFRRLARRGVAHADASRDGTVKVDVTGLRPGREYYYRFFRGEDASPVGRTKTLPEGPTEDVVLAVASCALYPGGFYNAYEAIAALERVDAVVHLGDYIYEYGPEGFGGEIGARLGRLVAPPHEILTLADYRQRHAQVKSDPKLQAAHARAPWIVVWDDHETANDSWATGAENHQPESEGAWAERKANAIRAWYEWMPIREPRPGRTAEAIQRSFHFGDLASLIMVETRLAGRSQPLDYATDLMVAGEPNPLALGAKLTDASRTMMGPAQEAWLAEELAASVASGRRWQVLGNQVVMARVAMPGVREAMGEEAYAAMLAALPEAIRVLVTRADGIAALGLPFGLDTWDGYPAARERLYDAFKAAGATPIVLSGDSHAFWANELYDAGGERRVAVEFGTTAISSPSIGDVLVGAPVSARLMERNREVVFTDQTAKGFVLLTLTHEGATAEMVKVSTIYSPQYDTLTLSRFHVRPTTGGVGEVTLLTG